MQAQSLQVQTCQRDIERIETSMDGIRSSPTRGDAEYDIAKKMMVLERELSQLSKDHHNEIHEIKQSMKDAELVTKNLRHQLDQAQSSHEFKKQEMAANQADSLQSMQLRIDQQERLMRKVNQDVESQHS